MSVVVGRSVVPAYAPAAINMAAMLILWRAADIEILFRNSLDGVEFNLERHIVTGRIL